jgi:hypothetical protein
MKVNNYNVVPPNVNCTVFGTDENGSQKNFNVQALLALNATPEVVTTNLLTTFTITKTNTYFTGTASIPFDLVLPGSNSNLNGAKYVIMSTTNRPITTWLSVNATVVGAPSALTANTPVCLQYNHANATWYISA